MSETLSRRDFLKVAGATGAGIGLGILFKRFLDTIEQSRVESEAAILRSVVHIRDNKNSKFDGTGFIEERDGMLSIVTVQHIAAWAVYQPSHALILGYPNQPIHLKRPIEEFNPDDPVFDDELIIHFPIGESNELFTRSLIIEGNLTPLQWINGEVAIGQTVVLPDVFSGTYDQGVVEGIKDDDLIIYSKTGLVCRGRSGGPVIMANSGSITNKVIGVVSKAKLDGLFCGTTVFAERG
ncbi:MAG: twin-arginine translocation signal domain-containing protein [Candidatus Woesebacteria bacterium]|nr:twin-arginine translocation signal domain-containing protein [Candidatus Woesebacteria bacterium]